MKKILDYFRTSVGAADALWKLVTAIIVLGGGTTAGFLAKTSEMFRALGPLAWFGVAIVASLALALIVFLVQSSRRASAEAAFANALAARPTQINPLESNFADAVIAVANLHLPGQQLHERKQFRRCRFAGPGVIAIFGGTVFGNNFQDLGHILTIPDGTVLTGMLVLKDCTIEHCTFVGLTVLILRGQAEAWKSIPGVQIAY